MVFVYFLKTNYNKYKEKKTSERFCYNCNKLLSSMKTSDLHSSSEERDADQPSGSDYSCRQHEVDKLNNSITDLRVSPVKVAHVSDHNRLTHGKRKIHQHAVATKVVQVFRCGKKMICQNKVFHSLPHALTVKTWIDWLFFLKKKMQLSSRQKKLQLLTLAPHSSTIARTVQEFGVSEYQVSAARKLRKLVGYYQTHTLKRGNLCQ